MKLFDRAEIMKNAWKMYRVSKKNTFAECLKKVWHNVKLYLESKKDIVRLFIANNCTIAKIERNSVTAYKVIENVKYYDYKNNSMYSSLKVVDGTYNKENKTISLEAKIFVELPNNEEKGKFKYNEVSIEEFYTKMLKCYGCYNISNFAFISE